MARKKGTTTLAIKAPKARTGAYAYQGSKTNINTTPKRTRTRATRARAAIKEASY